MQAEGLKTLSQLARDRGVSLSWVRKLLRQGRILDAAGQPVVPTRVGGAALLPADVRLPEARADYGTLTAAQRNPWAKRRRRRRA